MKQIYKGNEEEGRHVSLQRAGGWCESGGEHANVL